MKAIYYVFHVKKQVNISLKNIHINILWLDKIFTIKEEGGDIGEKGEEF